MGWAKKNGKQAARVERPLARSDELVVEEVDGQVLIYDQQTDEAHCLSEAAARVWRACDGQTSREQLATQLGLEADTVKQAIGELEACGLLAGIVNPGVTRREAATRFAKVGAAAAAAPLVYSIVTPKPAAAQSVLALCIAINGAVAGHDCGSQPGPGTVGCHSVSGCCCCHNFTASLAPFCAGDPEHCCVTASFCTSIHGHPCS